jgi:hypothetical protein
MSKSNGYLASSQTLKVPRFEAGVTPDGDEPINASATMYATREGEYVKASDVVASLNRMVALKRLTPETRTRIVEQLGLK